MEQRWQTHSLQAGPSPSFTLLDLFIYLLTYLLIYRKRVGEGQREERENPKKALHQQCRAQCGAGTHQLRDHDLT